MIRKCAHRALVIGFFSLCGALDSSAQLIQPEVFDRKAIQPKTLLSLEPKARGEALLELLRHELATPSILGGRLGGGPIDSTHIQGLIVFQMGLYVERGALEEYHAREADPSMKELLTIALGLAGSDRVVESLIRVLDESPYGLFRALAARALVDLNPPEAREALRRHMGDTYSGLSYSDVGDLAGYTKVYPVREAMVHFLRKRGEPIPDTLQPLSPSDDHDQALGSLLEDRDPEVCASAVYMLGKRGPGGRPYLEAFVAANRGNAKLSKSVADAEKILENVER